jgi:hypothetical protein
MPLRGCSRIDECRQRGSEHKHEARWAHVTIVVNGLTEQAAASG